MEYYIGTLRISTDNRYIYRKYGHKVMVNPNIRDQLMQLIMDLSLKHIFAEDVLEISPIRH